MLHNWFPTHSRKPVSPSCLFSPISSLIEYVNFRSSSMAFNCFAILHIVGTLQPFHPSPYWCNIQTTYEYQYMCHCVFVALSVCLPSAWLVQFLGHGVFEKRRPAFTDNLTQVFSAPFFIVMSVSKLHFQDIKTTQVLLSRFHRSYFRWAISHHFGRPAEESPTLKQNRKRI